MVTPPSLIRRRAMLVFHGSYGADQNGGLDRAFWTRAGGLGGQGPVLVFQPSGQRALFGGGEVAFRESVGISQVFLGTGLQGFRPPLKNSGLFGGDGPGPQRSSQLGPHS